MHMRLVNLERSSDRLALFKKRNAHLDDITRVSAIDGKTVERTSLIANGVIQADLRYSDGALGCALSHLRHWRDAVHLNQVLTIVEDDAILCKNFKAEAERTLALLPGDWDYVMWGYNFDAPLTFHLGSKLSQSTCMFSQDMLRMNAATFSRERVDTLLLKLLRGFGTMAYSISPRGAERLINFCLPLRPLTTVHPGLPGVISNLRIDNMLAHAWPAMSAHVAVPPLAISENRADASTVRANRLTKPYYSTDDFSHLAFLPIIRALGCDTGVIIGVRATHDVELASARLRQSGWTGFDIAVDPATVVKALTDRGIASQFDLLYIGPGCDLRGLLSALLTAFRPRAIIVSPEKSISARDLSMSPSGNQLRPDYATIVEAQGYSIRGVPEAPNHRLLFAAVTPAVDWASPDPATPAPCQVGFPSYPSQSAETVRLWS